MLEINKNTICIEDDNWFFGSEQMNVSSPIRFPTVMIPLESTNTLDKPIDAMRVEAGYLPMFPEDESMEYDCDGWYNFYATLFRLPGAMMCVYIEAVVCSDLAKDNEQSYTIDLTSKEQTEIIYVLGEQLWKRFGISCTELLKEAEQEMIEQEEWRRKNEAEGSVW